MISAPKQLPLGGPRSVGEKRGFTLVEVMVATVLLSMIILSILSALIGAYRVAAKARYNDHARYIIKSMADQFLTMQPTQDLAGNPYPVFSQMTGTGYGLTWTNPDGSVVTGAVGSASIPVLMGDNTGAVITAQVSRSVWLLVATPPGNANLGQTTLVPYNASAGQMLRGDFTISYSFQGTPVPPLTMSVVRAVP
jgi:prepilin-type N-terminal cleavage/methylation domain-containing protein